MDSLITDIVNLVTSYFVPDNIASLTKYGCYDKLATNLAQSGVPKRALFSACKYNYADMADLLLKYSSNYSDAYEGTCTGNNIILAKYILSQALLYDVHTYEMLI